MKPLDNGPFKILNKPTEVKYELLKQNEKRLHAHRIKLIPYYTKEPLLFPLIH